VGKLNIEELQDLNSSPNIVHIIVRRRRKEERHVAQEEEGEMCTGALVGDARRGK
jgi:hypothetical protein